jgi:4-hydroxy-tetrahydrodipicolinate reductase
MGHEVEKLARQKQHQVVLTLDVETNQDGAGLTRESVSGAEVVIDFTWPDAVLPNVRRIAELGLPVVEGTTGWYEQMDEVRQIVEGAGIGLVHGANFSIGANILFKLTEEAAIMFDRFEDYDPYVFEHHHRGKVDSPSGTAHRLAERILKRVGRKDNIQVGNARGRIASESIHVTSLRAGTQFGQHRVGFDSPADTLDLTLTSRGREGLARGALYAAEWILGKKGFYDFGECLEL